MEQGKIYVFARANQMEEHDFTDDVAMCRASNKKEAIDCFSEWYQNVKDQEISIIDKLPLKKVMILTDY